MITSQSGANFSILPIGIAFGRAPAEPVAMRPAAVGVHLLPANGARIAAVEIDQTGSTRIGAAVINHSFLLPVVSVGGGTLTATMRQA